MVREPGSRPEASALRTEPGAVSEREVTAQQKMKVALIAGGVLLAVGLLVMVFALIRARGADNADKAADINLTSAEASSTAPPLEIVAGSSPSPTGSPTAGATKPPKAAPSAPKPTRTEAEVGRKPTRVKATSGTSYRLRNVITGNCVSTMVFGAATTQEACRGVGQVKLEPTRAVNGVRLYRLREGGGANLCLDVPDVGSEPAGTAIGVVDCIDPSSADNQEWRLKDTGKTSHQRAVYLVVNFASGNCLDVAGRAADKGDRPTGNAIGLFPCSDPADGFDDHFWTFS